MTEDEVVSVKDGQQEAVDMQSSAADGAAEASAEPTKKSTEEELDAGQKAVKEFSRSLRTLPG